MKDLELKGQIPTKGEKITFQIFSSLTIEQKNLEFIHFVSSSILNGFIKEVNFYNASFLSTKFLDVTFESCNMGSTDICSVWVKNCRFFNCNFNSATISDCTFINCVFDKSLFESISLTRCQFIDCNFQQFPIENSTFSLNTFTRCQIRNTNFTESFYYQIFKECLFENANMPPELLGFNYGFSVETFEFLAQEVDLEGIATDFTEKGLYINAAILRINQAQKYFDEAMIACVVALGQMIQRDILIKADEIEFLRKLTSYLQAYNQIAPITILRLWQMLNSYSISAEHNTATERAIPHIREYANMLYFTLVDFQRELQKRRNNLPKPSSASETVELQIVYTEQPTFPLIDYLSELSSIADPACPKPHLIRTETGSFHEFHEIALIAMPYLQTFFSLLNIIVPIVIYKKQKNDHETEKKTTTEGIHGVEINISGITPGNSPILLPTTVGDSTINRLTSDVVKVIETQSATKSNGFNGYNSQNIQSVTIRFHL